MKKILLLTVILSSMAITTVNAQTKIKDGTVTGSSNLPNSNAILELESNNKGLLLPRVALTMTTNPSPLSAHVKGMTVYNTAQLNDVDSGLYFNDGTRWVRLSSSVDSATAWLLHGNAGTNAGANLVGNVVDGNYVGTIDTAKLVLAVDGLKHLVLDTMGNLYTGYNNAYSSTMKNTVVTGEQNTVNNTEGSLISGVNNTSEGITRMAIGNILGGTDNSFNDAVRSIMVGRFDTVSNISNGIIVGRMNYDSITNYTAIFGSQNRVTGQATFGSDNNIVSGTGNIVYTDNINAYATNNAVFGGLQKDSSSYNIISGNTNTLTHTSGNDAVFGQGNTAAGQFLVIGGQNNIDSSSSSIVAGTQNIIGASASNSAAFGYNNKLGGTNSLVTGNQNISNGNNNLVYGQSNTVADPNAGLNFVGGVQNTIVGNASGNVVVGGNNTLTTSSTNYGTAGTIIYGSGNTARGWGNLVGGGINGGNTMVYGSQNCVLFGKNNVIGTSFSGENFVTGESDTTTGADWVMVSGYGLNSINSYETVFGKYNTPVTNALFTVGNGTSSSAKSNAITITNTPASATATSNSSTLNVNGSMSASVNTVTSAYTFTASDYLVIYTGTSNVNFTLPDPATCKGRIYRVLNFGANAGNDVFVIFNYNIRYQNDFGTPNSGTSNLLFSSQTVASGTSMGSTLSTQGLGNEVTIISDGTQWVRAGI